MGIGYDNANRRTSLTLPNGIVMTSGYDDASQLTGITYTQGTTTLGNLAYGYDVAGRRNSVTGSYARTTLPGPLSSATYNNANQLTQWGVAVLAYDANGNMTSDGTNTFVWNSRNTLDSMNLAANSFVYDAFGRRMTSTIAATTTNYLYDGANIVQELQGGVATANLLSGGIDEVFSRTTVAPDPEGARYFLTDALGSPLALTDATGVKQTEYAYEPFGQASLFAGVTSSNSYQYTARENDTTGLYYYRARYYNPSLQRFISEDPLGYGGKSVNFYEYANGDPMNSKDPFGLSGCDQICQNQIAVLQNMFPGSRVVGSDPNQPTLVIPQSTDTVERALVGQSYQEPGQWWNPFLYWDPIAHAGGDEYRIGVGASSFHFRRRYPPGCPLGPLNPATCLLLRPRMVGRKTVLDQFHTDDHDPARDPKGHILHDVLHLPDYFDRY